MFRGWRGSTLIGFALAGWAGLYLGEWVSAWLTAASACVMRALLELLADELERLKAAERDLDRLSE